MLVLLVIACMGGTVDSPPPTPGDSALVDSQSGDSVPTGDSEADTSGTDTQDSVACKDTDKEWTRPERPDTSNPGPSDSWRYGGGTDYPGVVDPTWPGVTVVDSAVSLVSALEAAQPGSIVYVADDAVIDLTQEEAVCIPAGVWLAGGRGVGGAPGGLVQVTLSQRVPVFSVCGDDVRITGFRLIGVDSDECPDTWPDSCSGEDRTGGVNCRDCEEASIGIKSNGVDRTEIDNMELAGWSHAATWFTDGVDHTVHHNHIHHTQRQGLGYGVVLIRGGDGLVTVDIAWNRFNYNRHAVAGSGEPGQDYDAHDNLVLENAIGHVFDMHGENENTSNGSELAGGDMRVYDNTVLVDDHHALVVRGRPDHGAWLYNNCLARDDADDAVLQRHFTGNLYVDESPTGAPAPNDYGQTGPQCETERWCMGKSGAGPWSALAVSQVGMEDLVFGDFDGDGRADVFRATGSEWHVSSGGTATWSRLITSSYTLDRLAFGDFDGDGRTDVFASVGGEWRTSSGGTSPWSTLNTALADPVEDLGFADFDGDGRTDVFRTTGSEWQWSDAGSTPWQRLNTSGTLVESLALADFDGDGKADIFRPTGSQWAVSYGGTGSWTTLNSSSVMLSSLALGDLNGDGQTDVIRRSGTRWLVSWSGTSAWSDLRVESRDITGLALADFDGDGADDVFRAACF